jgi:glycerophosphoryl diester phosphodiesterase
LNTWARAPERRPLVLGHRGARHAAPENTLRSFQLALEQGADGVELDVRLDRDRNLVVLHDRTLARVTGWHDVRDVERVGRRELAQVELGAGARVPLLADVLAWAESTGARVNVELKHDVSDRRALVEGVAREARRLRDPARSLLLSSFHPPIVAALSRALPELTTAWLVHAGQRVLREAPGWRWLGARAVNPEHPLATAARIAAWKRRGALVAVWTVNDPNLALRLSALGVDAIISDVPGRVVEALASVTPIRGHGAHA